MLILDFKLGMIFPTGKKQNVDSAFDIPFGYNGHLGFGASFDFAVGVYNWLTFGGYGGAIIFADKTREIRMKTDIRQNGFIKLAKGCATVDKGTIWYAGAFGKLDHIAAGFSVLGGYTLLRSTKRYAPPRKYPSILIRQQPTVIQHSKDGTCIPFIYLPTMTVHEKDIALAHA